VGSEFHAAGPCILSMEVIRFHAIGMFQHGVGRVKRAQISSSGEFSRLIRIYLVCGSLYCLTVWIVLIRPQLALGKQLYRKISKRSDELQLKTVAHVI
jgi:hypothetical protein